MQKGIEGHTSCVDLLFGRVDKPVVPGMNGVLAGWIVEEIDMGLGDRDDLDCAGLPHGSPGGSRSMLRSLAKPRFVLTRTTSLSASNHTAEVCGYSLTDTVASAATGGHSTRSR
jgi:hypothetical protein